MKLRAFLAIILTTLIPIGAVVSCFSQANNDRYNIGDKESKHFFKEINSIVPKEMYPGVVNDPNEYEKLKNPSWVTFEEDERNEFATQKIYHAKNDYIHFSFDKQYLDVIESFGYNLESFSQKLFVPLSLSPDVEMFTSKSNVSFHNFYNSVTFALTDSYEISILSFLPNAKQTTKAEFDFYGSILLKEFSQVASFGFMPNGYPNWRMRQEVMWKTLVQELPKNHPWRNLVNAFRYNNSPTIPWTKNITNTPSDLSSWSKTENIYANQINDIYAEQREKEFNFHGSPAGSNGDIIEMVGRVIALYAQKFTNNAKNGGENYWWSTLSPIAHILNYNFFDENDPLQSYNIMKAIYHVWYGLGGKSGLHLNIFKDKNRQLALNQIRFKSFGNAHTDKVDKLIIFDNKTNKVVVGKDGKPAEFKINHKRYPLGFNKNPFTDYEYKYVAPGAWVNEYTPHWTIDEGWSVDGDWKDLDFKLLDKNGIEIDKKEVLLQINFREGKGFTEGFLKNNLSNWEEVNKDD